LEIVIDAMDSKIFGFGASVINQGDEGHELYVVEEGSLSCFKLFVIIISLIIFFSLALQKLSI
jgi:hypothetical protein